MKKITLFVLIFSWGMLCSWSGGVLPRIIIEFFPLSFNFANIIFGTTPFLLLIITIIYLVYKKKGLSLIAGFILGLIIGFLMLMLGLGLGNV